MSTQEPASVVDRVRWYAALSGPFDPLDALRALGEIDSATAREAAIELAGVCDTGDPVRWLMRAAPRRRELDALTDADALGGAVAWMRERVSGSGTADVLDAVSGTGLCTVGTVEQIVGGSPDRDELVRVEAALDRAGEHAPAHGALPSVRSAIARADARAHSDWVTGRGFFGREEELAAVEGWLSAPQTTPPMRALAVTGPAGIGKSSMLDEIARRAAEASWLVVRLDFERAGLDVQDGVGLTLEISRQLSRALGDAAGPLRRARADAAAARPATGRRADRIPADLAIAMGDAVRAAGATVLAIADGIEVLDARGQTHPRRLFEILDRLCEARLGPVSLIVAGDEGALDTVPERVGERLALTGLDDTSAGLLLESLDVPPAHHDALLRVAQGAPTVLRLGAIAVREFGRDAIDGTAPDAASLYPFLLDRIDDPALRALAQPGLIVRRIAPELMAEVLAPQIGIDVAGADAAQRAYDRLALQRWLVGPDVVGGWLRHRSEVRSVLLDDVYRSLGRSAAGRLNRAIAVWFGRRHEPFAPLEAAYHRLQAMRAGLPAPYLGPEVLAQIDDEMLDELDGRARDAVHRARGERTSRYRSARATRTAPESAAAQELESALARDDLQEAEDILRLSPSSGTADPASAAAGAIRTFLWRSGRWDEALAGRDPARILDRDARPPGPLVAIAHLEMWAESRFADLVRALRGDADLRALAHDLRDHDIPQALIGGALDLALLRAQAPETAPTTVHGDDPVGTAATLWLPGGLPVTGDRDDAVRRLAAATPYAGVVEATLRMGRDDGALRAHVLEVASAHVGRLGPGLRAGCADSALDALTEAGLFAEWLGSASFRLRRPALTLVARSAERWRRTMAGDWAYGTWPDAPGSWTQRPDLALRSRIARLDHSDALTDLARWSGEAPGDGARLVQRVRSRHPAADRGARGLRAPQAAVVLAARGVPSAFIPALAVLYEHERIRP